MGMKPALVKKFFPNLLSWKELEYLINVRPLMNIERVAILDENKNRIDEINWDNSPWTIDTDCYPPHLLKEYIEKYVCIFHDMSRCCFNINKVAEILEKKFNKSVDAHVYVCRNVNAVHPFGVHTDKVDNLIVQCEGKTNFKVWDPDGKLVIDCAMIPGDAVFIPASFPHEVTTLTPRMSVSFPLHTDHITTFEDRTWIKL